MARGCGFLDFIVFWIVSEDTATRLHHGGLCFYAAESSNR